jgi:hypothetical protein
MSAKPITPDTLTTKVREVLAAASGGRPSDGGGRDE